MKNNTILSLCLISLLLSCGSPKSQDKNYPSEPYNLMTIFELPDLQYLNRKIELVNDRGFADGQKWAKKEKHVASRSQVEAEAIAVFTKHYGTPEEMTDDLMCFDIYEEMRDDFVKSFSLGCNSVWSGQ